MGRRCGCPRLLRPSRFRGPVAVGQSLRLRGGHHRWAAAVDLVMTSALSIPYQHGTSPAEAPRQPRARSASPATADASLEYLDLVQGRSCSEGHTFERVVGQMNIESRLLLETLAQAPEQSSPTGQKKPALCQVGGQLGRCLLERRGNRPDDVDHKRLEGAA